MGNSLITERERTARDGHKIHSKRTCIQAARAICKSSWLQDDSH
nr:MAG TPA: hypothetical protein [Caudoviricetes sp.]